MPRVSRRWIVAAGVLGLVVVAAGFGAVSSLRANLTRLLLADPSTWSDPPVVTPSEVAARASFPVLWPSYLPASVGYANGSVGPAGSHGLGTGIEKGSSASFTWVDRRGVGSSSFIHIVEVKELYFLPSGQRMRIRGQAGVMTTAGAQRPASDPGPSEITIVWHESGLTLSVMGRSMSEADVRHVAESLQPLDRPTTIPFRDKAAQRINGQRAIVGRLADFPVPSVTHFANLKVYLVRGDVGFVALIDDDPHLHHPTGWSVAAQTFISPAHGEEYDWEGDCIGGPCPRGLDRYPVRIDVGAVVIDRSQRLPGRAIGDRPHRAPSPHPPFLPWWTESPR